MFDLQQGSVIRHRWYLLALLLLTAMVLAGCGDDDDPVTTDTTPPTIVSINPASGSANVPLNQTVTAVFSEKLAASTVNAATFTVAPATGTVALAADGKTATFMPATLLASTPYTVTLTTGITDEAGNALAHNSVTTFTTGTSSGGGVYTAGSYSFDYLKIDLPPESGTFSVTGVSLDPSGGFPTGVTQVCGGSNISDPDTSVAFCYGGKKNPDETVDIGIVVVTKAGGDVTAGSYSVGTDPIALFVYIEGAEAFLVPPGFDPAEIEDWLLTLVAERQFVSATGTITITTINDTSFQGTFGGNMLSGTAIFNVSNGSFSMSQ